MLNLLYEMEAAKLYKIAKTGSYNEYMMYFEAVINEAQADPLPATRYNPDNTLPYLPYNAEKEKALALAKVFGEEDNPG